MARPMVMFTLIPPEPVHVHIDQQRQVKSYLLGLLDFRLGDDPAVRSSVEQLMLHDARQGEDRLAFALSNTLQALLAWRQNDPTTALKLLDEAQISPSYKQIDLYPLCSQALNRFIRGEVLVAEGRDEEALRWYDSLADGYDLEGLPFLGPSHLRRAEIYERSGDVQNAIEQYERFTELWWDCDPELRPMVEKAQQRLDRLLATSTREVVQP